MNRPLIPRKLGLWGRLYKVLIDLNKECSFATFAHCQLCEHINGRILCTVLMFCACWCVWACKDGLNNKLLIFHIDFSYGTPQFGRRFFTLGTLLELGIAVRHLSRLIIRALCHNTHQKTIRAIRNNLHATTIMVLRNHMHPKHNQGLTSQTAPANNQGLAWQNTPANN